MKIFYLILSISLASMSFGQSYPKMPADHYFFEILAAATPTDDLSITQAYRILCEASDDVESCIQLTIRNKSTEIDYLCDAGIYVTYNANYCQGIRYKGVINTGEVTFAKGTATTLKLDVFDSPEGKMVCDIESADFSGCVVDSCAGFCHEPR